MSPHILLAIAYLTTLAAIALRTAVVERNQRRLELVRANLQRA